MAAPVLHPLRARPLALRPGRDGECALPPHPAPAFARPLQLCALTGASAPKPGILKHVWQLVAVALNSPDLCFEVPSVATGESQ